MFARRLMFPAAVGLALLAGAAFAQPPEGPIPGLVSPDAEVSVALQAVQTCMTARARAADDGVSAPDAIAAKIKDSCSAEQTRLMAASADFSSRHPGSQSPPPLSSDRDRFDAAKAAVIQLRKDQPARE